METTKQHITLIDEQTIERQLWALGNFTYHLRAAREEYLKIFENFEIEKFQKFFVSKNFFKDVATEWATQNKIDLPGLNYDVAVKIGLLQIPDVRPLANCYQVIRTQSVHLPGKYAEMVRQNLACLFNPDLNTFPLPNEGPTEMYEIVARFNTEVTETAEELEFIESIISYANECKKLVKMDLILESEYPRSIFSWGVDPKANKDKLYIPPGTLLRFRNWLAKQK